MSAEPASGIRLQPKASLFTMFARPAPKHRYSHAFGSTGLPNTVIYATFPLSYWCGCKCRRNRPPESASSQKHRYLRCFGPGLLQNLAIYRPLGGQCSQTQLFTQHLLSHTGPAVNLVETGFQPKASLFTAFWARAAPKHRYLQAFERPVLPTHNTFCKSYEDGA